MKHTNTQSSAAKLITSGFRRPSFICRTVFQLLVILRDCSASMDGRKAREATRACEQCITELASPSNKDGFEVAIVDFDDDAQLAQSPIKATALAGHVPTPKSGGSTNVTAAIEAAHQLLQDAAATQKPGITYLRPVVMVFSDGQHNTGADPLPASAQLKRIADVVAIAFGADADEGTLKQIATTEQHFVRVKDGRELRAFFAAVGKTMTQTMAAGINATRALGTLGQ